MRQPRKSKTPAGVKHRSEDALLLREAEKIVQAIGQMFAPSCEVVLHDLRHPDSAILAIANPISGRRVGQPTTEMGLARIRDQAFPDVVQNYSNQLPDGRRTKSTSIGLRNSEGECIAAICLNLDVSLFETVEKIMEQLIRVDPDGAPVRESFKVRSNNDVREAVVDFAAKLNVHPKALSVHQRRTLMKELQDRGMLQLRGAAAQVGEILGVARSSIYNALKANAE